jgi:hypothetical protein
MSSVKGTFQNGVARPLEPVSEAHEGQEVIITFVDEPSNAASADKGAARGKLRRHFGAWDSGNARSGDNEEIDRDLAGEFAGTRESKS